jgi:uncharacterized protein (TIGR03086 family)
MTFEVLITSLGLLKEAAAAVPAARLDDPTPCADWTVAQVLLHAAGDQHAWASVVAGSPPPSYNPFAPPDRPEGTVDELIGAAVRAATAAWQQVDADDESVATPLPPVPTMKAGQAAAACALDAAVHAWDVAAATGQGSPITPDLAEQLLPAARATAEPLRGFAYGPALPLHAGEDAVAELLRFLGRDPHWAG